MKQAALFSDRWPAPKTTQFVDSGWTHLETGDPLMFAVEPHQWEEFIERFPHLNPQFRGGEVPPPPPGFGTAVQATDYFYSLDEEQRHWISSSLDSLWDVQ